MGESFSAPQLAKLRTNGAKRAPLSSLERKLQSLWARILNMDPDSIGMDDSFFRLGGDSITAMQVSSAARESNLDMSAGDVLRSKTIARLLGDGRRLRIQDTSSALEAVPTDGTLPLSPVRQLYVRLELDLTKAFDQCFLLDVRSRVSFDALVQGLALIVSTPCFAVAIQQV